MTQKIWMWLYHLLIWLYVDVLGKQFEDGALDY